MKRSDDPGYRRRARRPARWPGRDRERTITPPRSFALVAHRRTRPADKARMVEAIVLDEIDGFERLGLVREAEPQMGAVDHFPLAAIQLRLDGVRSEGDAILARQGSRSGVVGDQPVGQGRLRAADEAL